MFMLNGKIVGILLIILLGICSAQPVWQRTYGGDDRDEAVTVEWDEHGFLLIVGSTRSEGTGESDRMPPAVLTVHSCFHI